MVINLDRREDRWERMQDQLTKLFPGNATASPIRISASDGKKLDLVNDKELGELFSLQVSRSRNCES